MPNATPVELELRGDFAKLKDEVEEAQRTIIEAAGQDQAGVDAKVDEVRRSADARAAKLRDKPKEADRPESHWNRFGAIGTNTSSRRENTSMPRRLRSMRATPKMPPHGPR